MNKHLKPPIYRDVIDALVQVCKVGQGHGVWNRNATQDFIPDQNEINLLLKLLTAADREILAGRLEHEVEVGVFETLKVLEKFNVSPLEDGYEGSPFNDFIGRLANWRWPEAWLDPAFPFWTLRRLAWGAARYDTPDTGRFPEFEARDWEFLGSKNTAKRFMIPQITLRPWFRLEKTTAIQILRKKCCKKNSIHIL